MLLILLTGCKHKMVCTFKNVNEQEGYETNIVYNINYEHNKVNLVSIAEIYESNDFNILDYYEEYRNIYYEDFNNKYGGITINSNTKDMVLTVKVDMDFNKIDLKSMIDDDKLKKTYVVNNYLTKNGAKLYFEEMGATCND